MGEGGQLHLDMQVVSIDVVSYMQKRPEKILLTVEQEKKRKYLDTFLQKFSISPLHRLIVWPAAYQHGGHTQTPGQPYCHQVAKTLLQYIPLCT